jgi:hypothetical protein
MKRFALWTLWLAIALQVGWIGLHIKQRSEMSGVVGYVGLVTVAFATLAATRGQCRWIASILRIMIGAAFVGAVCDRLGLFGPSGTPGVSWGDFQRFVRYTGQVNSFMPAAVIPGLAVVETFIEGGLGISMIFGLGVRWVIWGSTLLLTCFLLAMTISLGFASQFPYVVLVMASGAWLLAQNNASAFSVDDLMIRHGRAWSGDAASAEEPDGPATD